MRASTRFTNNRTSSSFGAGGSNGNHLRRLTWNIEVILLLVGLLAVFILGIVMSSHVQLLDRRNIRGVPVKGRKVQFEPQQMREEISGNKKLFANSEILITVSHLYR